MTKDWKRGVLAAADRADDYNGSTTHDYRLGDCIAGKLNVRQGRIRKNPKPLLHPDKAMTRGLALGLAEVHRGAGCSSAVVAAARDAGLTIAECKKAGVDPFDWRELKKAGVS